MPKNLMWDKTDESFSSLLESICKVDKVFRESRDTFLKQCIEIVKLQYQNNKNDCVDNIFFSLILKLLRLRNYVWIVVVNVIQLLKLAEIVEIINLQRRLLKQAHLKQEG